MIKSAELRTWEYTTNWAGFDLYALMWRWEEKFYGRGWWGTGVRRQSLLLQCLRVACAAHLSLRWVYHTRKATLSSVHVQAFTLARVRSGLQAVLRHAQPGRQVVREGVHQKVLLLISGWVRSYIFGTHQ